VTSEATFRRYAFGAATQLPLDLLGISGGLLDFSEINAAYATRPNAGSKSVSCLHNQVQHHPTRSQRPFDRHQSLWQVDGWRARRAEPELTGREAARRYGMAVVACVDAVGGNCRIPLPRRHGGDGEIA
jgi:hypothetical protein